MQAQTRRLRNQADDEFEEFLDRLEHRQQYRVPGPTPNRANCADEANLRILGKASREPKAPCVRRVFRLLQLMREAEEYRLRLYEHCFRLENAELRALSTLYFDRLRTIERLGKRYHWSPTLRGPNYRGLTQMITWRKGTVNQNWENWAVWWLMEHAAHGSSELSRSYILRFRQCGHCSKWFYAMTDHQRYCGINCRQKSHATSAEFREKRARYMREKYRPLEKQRDMSAKERA
jgi:hypothetical protein